jgi:hypothetical protein
MAHALGKVEGKRVLSFERLVAWSLIGALLASCSATRSIQPVSAEALVEYVLVIREQPEGQATHSWHRATDFDLSPDRQPPDSGSLHGRTIPVVARPRDCDEENRDCYRECMSRPLPRGYGHVTSGRKLGGKSKYCRERCWQPYLDCLELQGRSPQRFTSVDRAVTWLKENREVLLVGGLILIAGVAFVVISAGAGVLVLAPLVLVSSVETTPAPALCPMGGAP